MRKLIPFILVFIFFLPGCSQPMVTNYMALEEIFTEHKDDAVAITKALIARRRAFLNNYTKIPELIKQYEKNEYLIEISNAEAGKNSLVAPVFLSQESIEKRIGIKKEDNESIKSQKIYNFATKYFTSGTSLYREGNPDFKNPSIFLNGYMHGNCGIAANLFTTIATQIFKLKSAMLALNGHIASAIFHDNEWRIYDSYPDGVGFFQNGQGLAATYKEMVILDRQGKLKNSNNLFATTQDNLFQITEEEKESYNNPHVLLYPKGRMIFLNDLYLITTDNSYEQTYNKQKKRYFSKKQFLKLYKKSINNFIVENPIRRQDLDAGGKLRYYSKFPVLGAFIKIPQKVQYDSKKAPYLFTFFFTTANTNEKTVIKRSTKEYYDENGNFYKALVEPGTILSNNKKDKYLDFSAAINNLEPIMTHELNFFNIEQLFKDNDEVTLLTVHPFARRPLIEFLESRSNNGK